MKAPRNRTVALAGPDVSPEPAASGARGQETARRLLLWTLGAAVAVFALAASPYHVLVPYPVRAPGVSYWPGGDEFRLLRHGATRLVLVETFASCLVAIALGRTLLRAVWTRPPDGAVDRGLLALAAFAPGYLALVAVNRILTALLPNRFALPAVIIAQGALGVAAAVAARRARRAAPEAARRGGDTAAVLAAAAAVVVAFLAHQVQAADVHVVGDGASFFLGLVRDDRWWAPDARFPIVSQHYDELMFLYPAVQLHAGGGALNVIDGYWVLYAFGKAAGFAMVVLSVAGLSGSRAVGWLVALLLFVGGIHPAPGQALLVFDAANPLSLSLHPGRVLVAVLPIALLAALPRCARASREIPPAAWGLLLLVGAGLSSLTVTFAPVLACAIFLAIAERFPANRLASLTLIALCLLAPIALYDSPRRLGPAVLLVAACLLATLPAVGRALRGVSAAFIDTRRAEGPPLPAAVLACAALALGAAVGLALLGNVAVGRVHALLGGALEIVTRPSPPVPLAPGPNAFCGTFPLLHCTGFGAFATHLGLPFIVAGVAALMALRGGTAARDEDSALVGVLALLLALLVASLFAMDFMNGGAGDAWLGVWLKSRLPEPWFYSTLAVGVALVWRQAGAQGRRVLLAVLVGFVVLRHVLSEHAGLFGQIADNAIWVRKQLW